MRFSFRKGKTEKKLNLLKDANIVVVHKLIKEGYIKSVKKHFSESNLRNGDFKWDIIIRKNVRMRCSSLVNLYISLRVISRNE